MFLQFYAIRLFIIDNMNHGTCLQAIAVHNVTSIGKGCLLLMFAIFEILVELRLRNFKRNRWL